MTGRPARSWLRHGFGHAAPWRPGRRRPGDSALATPLAPFQLGRYAASIPSEYRASGLPGERFGSLSDPGHLQQLLEYNALYFNPHKMAPILRLVTEEPPGDEEMTEKLTAYLQHATSSVQLYENLKDLTAMDIAASVIACRQVGNDEAEDLSDALVATVARQIPKLNMRRVSFFVTNFASHKVADRVFWRAAAKAIMACSDTHTPETLIAFFDAFRKSGVRREKLYKALCHSLYDVLDDLVPAHIPPIVASICRVPLPDEERARILRALLSKWLTMLRHESQQPTGGVTMQQILSLTVSLGLAHDDINTAVFARDVSQYIGDRLHLVGQEDLIVFLWAMQRLVVSGSLTDFFVNGVKQVAKGWLDLQVSAQLSLQRLTQLSEVLVAVRQESTGSDAELSKLQDLVIADLTECVQYCQAEGLAELLNIWAGHEAFWRHYRDFNEAVAKRLEELLLESADLNEIMPLLQAALGVPGLEVSLPGRVRQVLTNAVLSRGSDDVERIRSVFAGTPWEAICGPGREHAAAGPEDASANLLTGAESSSSSSSSATSAGRRRGRLSGEAAARPTSNAELASFLSELRDGARGSAADALHALQSSTPFVQRLVAEASGDVIRFLDELGDEIVQGVDTLPPAELVQALHACGLAGLPHLPLFAAVLSRLDASSASGMQFVEALEACAVLRLCTPEVQACFERMLANGLERRLPLQGLARLLAASARLAVVSPEQVSKLLQRMTVVASTVRPPPAEAVAMLCHGLYLAAWAPSVPELFQVAAWLSQRDEADFSQSQAAAVRNFALALLARDEGRRTADCLDADLRHALAKAVMLKPAGRTPFSDTALKFRHEVAETLRAADQTYDLDLRFGPGVAADLAIAPVRSGLMARNGALWLLDGPEAFHRPFTAPSEAGSDGAGPALGEPSLQLVPAERRRAELLASLRCRDTAAVMSESLQSWHTDALPADDAPAFGLSGTAASSGIAPGKPRLARIHWLEWAAMSTRARLRALSDPAARPAVREAE
eukprot:TRINITY_DN44509_c0_g1_i1.p1 TRINITY_DN44509_c0_g1~~TRINITY_DN44509_c0_g1_i1.p1  ORF type:complete len:1013 (-),score=244.11 TRINITY_DN44509_c0_g1_i1:73-3111(-)